MAYVLLVIVMFAASAITTENTTAEGRKRELMWCGVAFLVWLVVLPFTI